MRTFNEKRKDKKLIRIGDITIGGKNDIAIQSMTNTDTRNLNATINQIAELKDQGCDIVRISVFDKECIQNIPLIKKAVKIPLVADIHYDYTLAIESIKNGIDKIRINPGNITDKDHIRAILNNAREYDVPIRIGVNTGSLPEHLYKIYNGPTPDAVLHAVKDQVEMFEKYNFDNIVIAAKSSDAMETVQIYRLLNKFFDYPLHVGVTEAGTLIKGAVKSSIALSILLDEGIADTIRISLTDDPVKEISVAKDILSFMGIKKYGVNIISCPTCGRTKIDIIRLVSEIERRTKNIKKNIDIAVMGCAVNGINEAKYADIGIAGGDKKAVLFKKGKKIRTVKEDEIIDELLNEIEKC
ncbi:MAG: flavodoxin-dependent (E)-4-hydroxy-3-methylbut-2-enyl-diphosphate synthase [Clostridia bacterium]|jgi:(E)-4-hydroxy-3-methylbut-2-enyl-diphosphate synthase|nr:flavodoxin-dependent (E)-4-hydroxy-3-methylbut-2-enyl-diphosphate synthase [Clostridia bacterium]MDD4501558.1 flavodoxin-dependent (E)-4-hydroxy-3-methylbut-2-enyl-diphosphate synthase [Clostridia bacterium]